MAFTEAGNNGEVVPGHGPGTGLSMRWDALREKHCPKCQGELEEFAHVMRFVCKCGFKISRDRLEQIVNDMRPGRGKRYQEPEDGWGRFGQAGFRMGKENYDDETPF